MNHCSQGLLISIACSLTVLLIYCCILFFCSFCNGIFIYVAFYTQLYIHVFRIICIDYSHLFTRCLNYYTKHSMSLHLGLPVTLYCSMHFRRHGDGSRSGSGLWLSDGWYVELSRVCLRACADGLWTVCMCGICAGGSIQLYLLHILHNIILHLLRLFYLSLL